MFSAALLQQMGEFCGTVNFIAMLDYSFVKDLYHCWLLKGMLKSFLLEN